MYITYLVDNIPVDIAQSIMRTLRAEHIAARRMPTIYGEGRAAILLSDVRNRDRLDALLRERGAEPPKQSS